MSTRTILICDNCKVEELWTGTNGMYGVSLKLSKPLSSHDKELCFNYGGEICTACAERLRAAIKKVLSYVNVN